MFYNQYTRLFPSPKGNGFSPLTTETIVFIKSWISNRHLNRSSYPARRFKNNSPSDELVHIEFNIEILHHLFYFCKQTNHILAPCYFTYLPCLIVLICAQSDKSFLGVVKPGYKSSYYVLFHDSLRYP